MTENIRVVLRVKPPVSYSASKVVCQVYSSDTVVLSPHSEMEYCTKKHPNTHYNSKKKLFQFDNCFGFNINGSSSSQKEVYENSVREYVNYALEGYNCCIFAYGQTGTGKTFTMIGDNSKNDLGLIPRFCQELFHNIESLKDDLEQKSGMRQEFSIEVSFFEIYNEHILELINPNYKDQIKYRIREREDKSTFVENLNEVSVSSYTELLKVIEEGFKNRKTKCTDLNENSSRSHAILSIIVRKTVKNLLTNSSVESVSTCKFVDLAGSERANSTLAYPSERLKEGTNINLSLSTLRRVMTSLGNNDVNKENCSTLNTTRGISPIAPYRESILTWILKDNLGGNSKTCLIGCLSPTNYDETLSTLRYSSITKNIRTNSTVNMTKSLTEQLICGNLNTNLQNNTKTENENKAGILLKHIENLNKYLDRQVSADQNKYKELNYTLNYTKNESKKLYNLSKRIMLSLTLEVDLEYTILEKFALVYANNTSFLHKLENDEELFEKMLCRNGISSHK